MEPNNVAQPVAKRQPRIKSKDRSQAVLALRVAGLKQREIAQELGVELRTVQRDIHKAAAAQAVVRDTLSEMQAVLGETITVKTRAMRYAELATSAKNEAVSLGALQRIDDLQGIITEKERLRAKGADQAPVQPMFVLPAGSQVQVTLGMPQHTTTSSNERASNAIDVTPSKDEG